uniref:PIPO n=1 Tax=Strongyloides venezuelensis TaxID=75913 RepID=A0A0K0FW86_STRVS
GGADGAQVAAGQGRLEQVGRVARAGGTARAHQRVNFINKKDYRLRRVRGLFQQRFQARFKFTLHGRPSQQRANIQ